MSSMKLRDSIRAPLRYGEDDDFDESRRTSLRYGCDDFFDDSVELGESGRPRPQKKRKPNNYVPFNPNLPPAAFPTLDRPQPARDPTRQNRAGDDKEDDRQANGILLPPLNERSAPALAPLEMEDVPMSRFEDHIGSNNMDNPVYARNVELASMAHMDPTGFEEMDTSSDSDDDTLPNATQALLDAIPNPKWSDLHRAMQVEIIENVMKHHSWRRVCDLLDLGADERTKFMETLGIRNKQIERENKRLEQMRLKQRNALLSIDNSDLKLFVPPPQLVLKKIARETTRKLVLTKYTDLLMCQAHDVLKARQYLHQHGLPRRYAGDWGDSLVVLRESEDSPHEPDKFEWAEDLEITPPPDGNENQMEPSHNPSSSVKATFIQSAGISGTMNPKDLLRHSSDPQPIPDWSKYFERNPNSSWNTDRPRHGGFVRLHIGPNRAAQIQQYDRTGIRPQERPVYMGSPRPSLQSSPLPENPQDTPSKPPRKGTAQPRFLKPAKPFSRVLTEDWPPKDRGPSESQARFSHSMHQARLEKMEVRAKEMRRRYSLQPGLRVDGVGAGINFADRDPQLTSRSQPRPVSRPRSLNQSRRLNQPRASNHSRPRSQPVEANLPSNLEDLPSNFFSRAHRGMTMGDFDQMMSEFICFEPIVPPEESEPEQTEEEAAENLDDQESSDVSSLTDLSMDDVMLVPTDGCSPSL
ncbi:hypothetical protein N7457_000446 [Penicillium paradoxum]|uniref:uncharacterized protein n=1 Tax=Penicillium paradoxum TaxID=176176 RepID=UPI00254684A9|nr:uncharacterized protein N7457_000446 [Penicillium paradoxum]KAJ5793847.1 hypothetical protein N7457_000446 [Penicillium paradoxum]